MSDARRTGPPTTGTYLFVKPPEARRARRSERPTPPPPRSPARDSIVEPLEPPSIARLRYRRPRLDPAALDGHLVSFLDPEAEVAAVWRDAAERLLAGAGDARRVWITAPRAGTGRTTAALNLAASLAETRRVTVLELDFQSPGVARAVGLDDVPGVLEMVRSRRRDRQAPVDLHLLGDGLAALPAGARPRTDELPAILDAPELRRLIEEVSEASDLLLVDGPLAAEAGALTSLHDLLDGVLLVIRPVDLASGAFEAAIDALGDRPLLGVLVNDAPDGPPG
jgi:Mrp family chromosome partitioning ATPase